MVVGRWVDSIFLASIKFQQKSPTSDSLMSGFFVSHIPPLFLEILELLFIYYLKLFDSKFSFL